MKKLLIFICLIVIPQISFVKTDLLIEAINNEFRSDNNKKRDRYRNPLETLTFFEIEREKKILEIIPGRGWYTEILSRFMKDSSNFYVATYEKPSYAVQIINKIQAEFSAYFKSNEQKFGEIKYVKIDEDFKIKDYEDYFDIILTFRNTHNFLDQNKAENMYNSFHRALKKGGILGVVQHRSSENLEFDFKKGYVKESFLIEFIKNKGFQLVEKSEINSNPKDKKNYPKGVWTLPPRLTEGEKNKEYYISIGESDRMTLKFKKK